MAPLIVMTFRDQQCRAADDARRSLNAVLAVVCTLQAIGCAGAILWMLGLGPAIMGIWMATIIVAGALTVGRAAGEFLGALEEGVHHGGRPV